MSAGREGFDLLREWGRRNFMRHLLRGRFQRKVWGDTFGRILCALEGEHITHQDFSDPNHVETSCVRCARWLKQEGHRWVVRKP